MSARRPGHLKVSSLGGFTQSSRAYIRQFNLSFSVARERRRAKLVGNEQRGRDAESIRHPRGEAAAAALKRRPACCVVVIVVVAVVFLAEIF